MSLEHAPKGVNPGGYPSDRDAAIAAQKDDWASFNIFRSWGFAGTGLASFISFWFTLQFFYKMAEGGGGVSVVEWIAIIPISIMLTVGMIFCAYAALYRVFRRPAGERVKALAVIGLFWACLIAISQWSNHEGALSERAEEIQFVRIIDNSVTEFREATRGTNAAESSIALMESDYGATQVLFNAELRHGALTLSPGPGPVTTELQNISSVLDISQSAMIDYSAGVADEIRQGERIIDEIRRLRQNQSMDVAIRDERLSEKVADLQSISAMLVQSLPTDTLIALQEALSRDFARLGFPVRAVRKLDETYGPAAANYAGIVSIMRDARLSVETLHVEPKEGLALIASVADELGAAIIAIIALDLFGPLVVCLTLLLAPSSPKPVDVRHYGRETVPGHPEPAAGHPGPYVVPDPSEGVQASSEGSPWRRSL